MKGYSTKLSNSYEKIPLASELDPFLKSALTLSEQNDSVTLMPQWFEKNPEKN